MYAIRFRYRRRQRRRLILAKISTAPTTKAAPLYRPPRRDLWQLAQRVPWRPQMRVAPMKGSGTVTTTSDPVPLSLTYRSNVLTLRERSSNLSLTYRSSNLTL